MNEGFMALKIAVFLILISFQALAARLNTQCTMNIETGAVEGLNIRKQNTIASVSKLFTTHWAINRLGAQYRFETLIHITPLGPQMFDVHIQGSLFPYFDRTNYQFLIGELNRLGVSQINYLTYDEQFAYASDMRTDALLAHSDDDITAIEIMKDLRQDTETINNNLAALNAKALAVENLTLPKKLTLSIKDIHPLRSNEFRPTAQTKTFKLRSNELYRVLKEFNRNSHNFAADLIFAKLRLNEGYHNFIANQIPSIKSELTFYNGSGYPMFINGNKVYNSASCYATLEVMADLKRTLESQGFNFQDVAAVAGKDSSADGLSTVTQLYGADQTNGTLIGKTGTVATTVALSGMISTDNENLLFSTNYAVANSAADRRTAYANIKNWIISSLIKDKRKSELNTYRPKTFLAFDKQSQLTPAQANENKLY